MEEYHTGKGMSLFFFLTALMWPDSWEKTAGLFIVRVQWFK